MHDIGSIKSNIKKSFKIHHLPFFIVGLFIAVFLFLPAIVCHANSPMDPVDLGWVGVWNNNYYGIFKDIEIEDIQGNAKTEKYAFCVTSVGMVILDINDIEAPYVTSFVPVSGCRDIEIKKASNNGCLYAYIATDPDKTGQGGVYIYDVHNPEEPRNVSRYDTNGNAMSVAITEDDNYAYVALGIHGLKILDIRDKSDPREHENIPGLAQGVVIEGEYAYVAGEVLKILDISNPDDPNLVGKSKVRIFNKGGIWSLAIAGDYAYGGNWETNLKIIDIKDPNSPRIIGIFPGAKGDVTIVDDYAYVYVPGPGVLKIFDISSGSTPIETGFCMILGFAGRLAVSASGDYAYVAYVADRGAGLQSGLQIVDISNKKNPTTIVDPNDPPDIARDMAIRDMAIDSGYAYLTYGENGLEIIDTNNPNGPMLVGACDVSGYANGVAVEEGYAYVTFLNEDPNNRGLKILDISEKGDPKIVGDCYIPGTPGSVAIEGDYVYVADADRGLRIIYAKDRSNPTIDNNIPVVVRQMAVEGNFAYLTGPKEESNPHIDGNCVIPGIASLKIFDISDKNYPNIVKSFNIPGFAEDVAIAGDNIYVTFLCAIRFSEEETIGTLESKIKWILNLEDPNFRLRPDCIEVAQNNECVWIRVLQIIDIQNPYNPYILSPKILDCFTAGDPSEAFTGVAVKDEYAFVVGLSRTVLIIDISDPYDPQPVRKLKVLPEDARNVAAEDDYIYVTCKQKVLMKFKIDIGRSLKGNLILVAGWNGDYESPYWHATQTLANQVFTTFINNGYETYEIYYHNPAFIQDIDNDGIPNQLVVDYPNPSCEKLKESILKRDSNQETNTGPLYIYLIGHGGEDRFQIMPSEVITASDLRDCIDDFQYGYEDANSRYHPGADRQVVVIVESAASGTFIDDLMDGNVTVITSTDDGASYIKPDFSDTDTMSYYSTLPETLKNFESFTSSFINALGPNLDPDNDPNNKPDTINAFLKDAFIYARDELGQWGLEGPPFADQAPQMAIPKNIYASLSFCLDGNEPIDHLFIDQNIPYELTIIAEDTSGSPDYQIDPNILFSFFSSNPDILNPNSPMCTVQDGICRYQIIPKMNGIVILTGYADITKDLLLSAKITIEVSIDDSRFAADPERMAIIVAGYRGTGDYLWESTNYIANHAYRSLTDMGYAKDEICYYSPYLLQDLDENGKYDDIKGYPQGNDLDPDTNHSILGWIKERGVKELLLFFVDHGGQGSFSLNPKEDLLAIDLIEHIKAVSSKVEKLIFIYDACNSGSFLQEIEKHDSLSQIITITSTDPNQAAYFLNQGIVSFSYPFFEEWFLTHSLLDAFDYASSSLPLKGQTPCITDPNIVWQLDMENIYYIDESRPLIEEVKATRENGWLIITLKVHSLTGIKEVWAIVEGAGEAIADPLGEAITEAAKLPLEPLSDPNAFSIDYKLSILDPCPNETNYIINLYALDKSTRSRMASYKISIGTEIENQTLAFIIGDPNLMEDPNEVQKVGEQIDRAEKILIQKGVDGLSIIRIPGDNELGDLASLVEENYDRNIFIYLIGEGGIRDGKPYFSLNPNDITPSFLSHLPYGSNQRLLILMDCAYSSQFLAEMDTNTNTLPENWAGIASTNREGLFFPVQEEPFPCFSNFFFSLVLSGATVSQAYWMAQNAVSLTRQNPEVFLPEEAEHYQDIEHHLNYYLGSSGIQGDDYPLFSDCTARVENGRLVLSLMAHPEIDTNDFTAWAILKSSPSSIDQQTMIVDFDPDPNNSLRYIPDQEISYVSPYCRALFLVEGRRINDESSKTEWEEVPIAKPDDVVIEDEYEPDDDPNEIRFDPSHEVRINAMPRMHNFFCEPPETCYDIDWIYFYGLTGQIYEIYAQDLSEYGYFIELRIYDPNMRPHYDTGSGQYSVANNYLAFDCPESGYYLLRVCPQGGVSYILSVCNPRAADGYSDLVFQVKDAFLTHEYGVRGEIKNSNDPYICPDFYKPIFSKGLHSWKFNGLTPNKDIIFYILSEYEENECDGEPISYWIPPRGYIPPRALYEVTIDSNDIHPIIDPNNNDIPEIIDPNLLIPYEDTDYYKEIGSYNLNTNRTFRFGDMDPNLPPGGDYDGDGICNYDEAMLYESLLQFPTISLTLVTGLNLFYFPSINEKLNIVSGNATDIVNQICYKPSTNAWDDYPIMSNHFNAIDASAAGVFFLDIVEEPTIPVLQPKGFLFPAESCEGSHPACCLNTNLFDPNCFKVNTSISEILNNPNLTEIEEISGQGFPDAKWWTTYPFFERFMGEDKRIDPYGVYIIKNKKGIMP